MESPPLRVSARPYLLPIRAASLWTAPLHASPTEAAWCVTATGCSPARRAWIMQRLSAPPVFPAFSSPRWTSTRVIWSLKCDSADSSSASMRRTAPSLTCTFLSVWTWICMRELLRPVVDLHDRGRRCRAWDDGRSLRRPYRRRAAGTETLHARALVGPRLAQPQQPRAGNRSLALAVARFRWSGRFPGVGVARPVGGGRRVRVRTVGSTGHLEEPADGRRRVADEQVPADAKRGCPGRDEDTDRRAAQERDRAEVDLDVAVAAGIGHPCDGQIQHAAQRRHHRQVDLALKDQ